MAVKHDPMKDYAIQLGNTEERAGHRKSCAQVRAQIFVRATSKEGALDLVQKRYKAKRKKIDVEAWSSVGKFTCHEDAGIKIVVSFRVDSLTLKDIKEV